MTPSRALSTVGRSVPRWRVPLVALTAASPAAAELVPAVYGSAPAVADVRISPAGNRALAIVAGDGKHGVAIMDLAGGPPTVALQPDPRRQQLDGCGWASNDRLVCSVFLFPEHRRGAPYPRRRKLRLVAVDVDGGRPLSLLDRRPRKPPKMAGVSKPPMHHPLEDLEHAVVHYLPRDEAHVLVRAAREADPYTSLYRVDVHTGAATRVLGFQFGIVLWHADWQGKLRLGTGWYEYGNELPAVNGIRPQEPWLGPTAVAIDAAGTVARLDVADISGRIGEHDLAGPKILGFSRDGARVYYEARVNGADRTAVWEGDANTLVPKRKIAGDRERDVRALGIGGEACGIVGFMHPLPGRPFTWLDAAFGRDVAAAEAEVPGEVMAVTSMSADCQRVVLAATDHRTRKTFHLLDRASGELRSLGEQYPRLADGDRSERRVARFATRDGLDLPITLTLPTVPDATRPPVVVLLEGTPGPSSTDALNTWPHFFASRGYAVAQPAVRGTRGYGTARHTAGRRQRGAKLQEDVADALAWLSARGLGDGGRACLAGRGRGGHLALAAALGSAADARCVAVYAARDIRYTKREHDSPYGPCSLYPCNDQAHWEAPHFQWFRATSSPARAAANDDANSNDGADRALLRSPLAGAAHPGFPILIKREGAGVVHRAGSSRFRSDVKAIQVFEHIAPVGSDAEAEFLAEAEALFAEVLGRDGGGGATPANDRRSRRGGESPRPSAQ